MDGAPRMRRHNTAVKESTIVKSLLIVVLVFFICMTPFSVTKLLKVMSVWLVPPPLIWYRVTLIAYHILTDLHLLRG